MDKTLFCDLHVHSLCSDGMCTPEEVVRLAKEAGLAAVALTDHNTIVGLERFAEAAETAGIQPVFGCEFSTEYAGKELHILGLCLPREAWPEVTAYTDERNKRKARSNRECCERLAAAGYDISYDAILEANPGASINRIHISRALYEKGYAADVWAALKNFLQPEQGFFLDPARVDALETIRRIKSWGGAAVWAHPLSSATAKEAEAFLTEAVPEGLDGIETIYSLYSPEDTLFARSLAEKYGILQSGGSDFHGANKPDIAIGTGRGNLRIPLGFLNALADRAAMRRTPAEE